MRDHTDPVCPGLCFCGRHCCLVLEHEPPHDCGRHGDFAILREEELDEV